jgi:hypothetical protein
MLQARELQARELQARELQARELQDSATRLTIHKTGN